MSLYDDLRGQNIYRLLSEKLKSGELKLRGSDGKLIANLGIEWNTPWVHCKSSYLINCYLWKDVIFHGIVEKQLPPEKRFVPIGCQECFKVVVRPKTLEQLFALENLQRQLNHPGKCGIEVRPSVFGNYGGYFYNRGINAGLECYKMVRQAVDEDPYLGPDVKVILKRACTEMEHLIGPSDKWKITHQQIEFEMNLTQKFVNDLPVITQCDDSKIYTRQMWIEHAYSVGDETVFKFTGGKPIYPDYVTYHHLIDLQNGENNGEKI